MKLKDQLYEYSNVILDLLRNKKFDDLIALSKAKLSEELTYMERVNFEKTFLILTKNSSPLPFVFTDYHGDSLELSEYRREVSETHEWNLANKNI